MKEVLKIKRVVGCILKDEKVFVRILWEDKLVTWESPETLRCPLLFTNFLNKVDGLLQKKAFEEERIRRKVEEKSFISSIRSKESITGRTTAPRAAVLEHNRINRHIIKTAGQRTDELEKHKEFQHTYIANQKIVKEGNRSAKQQSESFGQKLNLGPYKSSFRASNKIFLNSQRYFEAPLSKQTGYIEKEEVDIQSKENDFVVLIDSVKIATFSYVCILGNLAMPFGKQFNVSRTIGFAEFENIMFSARQNVNFGDYDVYNLKLLNNNDKFRDLLLQGKENHVFVDISGEISFVLFLVFNSNKLKKYNICGYYNLVRIPAKTIRYAINPRLDKSLCDSYNLWQKNTYQYVDRVFRHFLISGPNLAEDKILKFSIFASSSNFLANEIRKFLTSRGKKYVSMDHTEIDTIFVHVEYLQFLNNMPFYFMLIESNCSFYFFGTSILKREGYFVAPMLKEGGVLLLADSIATQIDDQQLSQVMAFLRKDNMSKWQLVIGSSLAKKLESMLCQMPQNDTVRNVLFLSQNNVVGSSNFVPEEYIRNLRKKHLIEKRHFYILDPKINDNLHKTPKQFINIINNHK